MRSVREVVVLATLSLATLAGCVSFGKSAGSRFYLLTSTIAPSASAVADGRTVGLLPVEIPKSVRRPQLVYVAGENEIALAGFSRWAEPLEDGLGRVMAENLAALLPGQRIEGFPFPPGVPIDVRVSVHVTDFRLDPTVPEARLAARWAVYGIDESSPAAEGSWSAAAAAADSSAASLVGAMSALVGDLTRDAVERSRGDGGTSSP